MYKKTFWEDEILDEQGQVLQEGTPLNAYNLNNIEDEVFDSSNKIEDLNIKTNSNKNEIDSMKESIVQNRPIVISDDVPIGAVTYIAGNQKSLPSGWLWASGQELSKLEYPELFEQLQYTWGGNGDKFNLPNLEKRYIRGTSDDLPIGTYQEDSFKSHDHIFALASGKQLQLAHPAAATIDRPDLYIGKLSSLIPNKQASAGFDDVANSVKARGGDETRPKTIVLAAIIKVKQLSQGMQSVAQEWTSFKETGGEIGGELKLKDLLLNLTESQSSVKSILNHYIRSGLLYHNLKFNAADGNGAALFLQAHSAMYFHVAVDVGRPSAYLIGVGSRHLGGIQQMQVLHSNILSYGASNSQGTQVINGAASDVILQFVICLGV